MDLMRLDDGTRLATWTDGALSGFPPIVILHGGPGLWDDHAALAALSSDITMVHRYDQRGCGRSLGPGHHDAAGSDVAYTVARSVADLEELREIWQERHGGHERWIVLGHSFGADLAIAYAGVHPDRVAAVGYLDGTGIGDWHTPYEAERARRIAPWRQRRAELTEHGSGSGRTWDEEVEWRSLTWATDFADVTSGVEYARRLAGVELPINYAANRALARDPDVSDDAVVAALRRVRCPVWFVHGSADPRPVGTVVALSRHARRARKRIIEDAGHFPWIERPARVGEVMGEIVRTAG